MTSERIRARSGSTVRVRLVLLVMFPLALLTLALAIVAQDRWDETEAAGEVVERVEDLRSLIALQSAVYDERAAVELEVRSASFGVPVTLGAGLLGVQSASETHAATDAAIAAAATAPPGIDGLITEARRAHSDGATDAIRHYERIDGLMVERLVFELNTMQRVGVGTADPTLTDALAELEASVLLFAASIEQTTGLAEAWFGADPTTRFEAIGELGEQSIRYESSLEVFDISRFPASIRSQLDPASDPVLEASDGLRTGVLERPGDGDFSNLDFIINVFRGSFNRNGALAGLVATSAAQVETIAATIADDASGSFTAALLFGSLGIAASIVLSWRLARGISSPMGLVAERTRSLQAGHIETAPLAMVGPRELRDVAGAINEMSGNLASLEFKLNALARSDLDDPSLGEPLPGQLGETLTKSVDTLSQSISDRRDLQARLAFQANHDGMTGLLNRAAILDALSAALADGGDRGVGVMFVDLDDFKRANDVFGHGVGDAVLMEAAVRLRTACRSTDVVARLGGDEFLVLVKENPGLEQLRLQSERIVEAISQPMHVPGTGGLQLSASVGVAEIFDPALGALELLAQADAALYVAKGTDVRVAIFDDDLRDKLSRNSTIEQRLREALANDQLEVHYQPVVSSGSLAVDQLEALVRWVGEEACGPDVFIPVAEASDLVIEIDRFVLRAATTELARLQEEGRADNLSMAVNISGRHLLHADVADHVAEALEGTALEPGRLIIEVTETALVADLDRAAEHLAALRRVGVRVSVDDFGTGFTSISQLRRLPIDELKIDRSIVMELPGDQTLVRVVKDLAEHFGLDTVAEGVETQQQADFLRHLGCTQLQGWLYARAMPPAELRRWIDDACTVVDTVRVAGADSP